MKVTYPLSLKVSVWLLLNLLLLALAVAGFFFARGGLGWNALMAGPSGEHAQAKSNIVASELVAAAADSRAAVLSRYAASYAADLMLVRGEEIVYASSKRELPAEVRKRLEPPAPTRGSMPRPDGGGGFGSGPGSRSAPTSNSGSMRPPGPRPLGPGEFVPGTRKLEPGEGGGGPPMPLRIDPADLARERERSRFLIRSAKDGSYWIGSRVPFPMFSFVRGQYRAPAFLLARVNSLWGLLHYLELQSWLLTGTGLVALSILFWLPLVRSITRSVGQLTAATEQIAEGRFDTRVDSSRRDELGKLGEAVNRMAERLDAHMNGQKRFLGDVAHELCSPLARLQMATGILQEQAPSNLRETVADVREEAQQMSSLVNELLAFTRAGLRAREIACSPLELGPVVAEAMTREDSAGLVKVDLPAELRAMGERDLLVRALGNLVRNAVRYAGTAGPISISAARDGKHVVLAVEDEGPGVPPEALPRLGEPFFRPEEARTRESGGVGLGLAIVRNSVAACGGEVRFANRQPRGFRAEIRLLAT